MPDGEMKEFMFRPGTEWVDPEACICGKGRDDNYITAQYDVADGTYSLTYHPLATDVTTHHFTQHHAVLALRDAGYSFPQIVKTLNESFEQAHSKVG